MEFRQYVRPCRCVGRRPLGPLGAASVDYIVAVAAMWAVLFWFNASIGMQFRLKYEAIDFFGGSVLLLSPMWLLGRRRRWLAMIPAWLVSCYLAAASMYCRFWGDLLPLKTVFNPASWNGLVFRSSMAMIDVLDIVIVALPLMVAGGIWLHGRMAAVSPLQWSWRLAAFGASLLLWGLTLACSMWHTRGYLASIGQDNSLSSVMEARRLPSTSLVGEWSRGCIRYICYEIGSVYEDGRPIDLSDEDKQLIINNITPPFCSADTIGDRFEANRGKNLIFIVVESLNAEVVGLDYNGCPLTPVLDSLLRADGTVSCLDVMPQIGSGGSSDGQFIYNTGLLPLFKGCTAQLYGDNDYPSLIKSLRPAASADFIVEEGRVWNHKSTSAAYGYDRLYDAADMSREGISPVEVGGDRAVFDMALKYLPAMPRPFFAEVVTLSMHFPYDDPGVDRVEWIDDIEGIGDIERCYLQAVNYFDRQLGLFMDGLKREDLWENSVVVIASDHDQAYKDGVDDLSESNVRPIVFMAVNTGETRRVAAPALQMDVYPTVLDIMGCRPGGYRGLGRSLAGEPAVSVPAAKIDTLRRVSDLIIRSDYFRTHNQPHNS